MIDCLRLLRNVGQFDSVAAGADLPLARFSVIYAENGRGKTTIAAILRSLANGDGPKSWQAGNS
jgi:wobble nucleotide-excising tRNase